MGKKKFIDKKKAATFELCPRDTSDPRYSDAPGGDKIFLRVDQNPVNINGFIEEEDEEEGDSSRFEDAPEDLPYGYSSFGESSSNPLPAHVRKEILELGYPDDGYNYLEHLREIKNTGGGSNFYANPKFVVDQLPRDVKAYDASRVKISGMMNEEGNDNKLMYSVASKTVNVKVQKAIDPEVAALLENSDGSEFGSDVEDLEEDFVIQANLTQQGETSGVSNGELEFSERREVRERESDKPVAENPRVPRQIDELFDQLELNEYGSDSDCDGYIAEDGEEEDFMAHDVQNFIHEKAKDYELEEKYMNPADILKNSDSVRDKEEVDTAAHVIRRTVEYAENFDKGNEDEFVELTEESSDESEKHDCLTIVSTYSNLDNLPGKILASESARQKKLSGTVAKALSSNGRIITLQGREKIPVEFLPGRRAEQADVKAEIPKAEPIKRKTHGQESKEEKKERKNAVKTEKREARIMKKQTSELYRYETLRAQKAVASSGPKSKHL
ncbi:Low temperature viability protein [Arabidopsis suecica]|uniref:Low temperature viability protein n=1 Tax=Arabidopsis suecica TaxID=45249 RepID=A0A8T1ZXY9_ARASU|nr:Low temperature viability protein [Arabidopsis suecica]